MSKGYDRNHVNAIVRTIIRKGEPYSKAIERYHLLVKIGCSFETFTNALNRLQKVVDATANAIIAFSNTFDDTKRKEMI